MSLKRSGFAPKWTPRPAREWTGAAPTARKTAVAMLVAPRRINPQPKENPIQHLGYMAKVRKIACRRCWTEAIKREFCHGDTDKGMGIKTDCRLGWSGCPPCHAYVGGHNGGGRMSKEGRREFERFASASTRAEVIARGWWPKRLPMWGGT